MHLQHDEECLPEEGVIRAQLKQLQSKRVMKSLALIQDLSDSTLALNDITGIATNLQNKAGSCRGPTHDREVISFLSTC